MKPTWVFVVGTYRTGSTTQYLLAEAIIRATKHGTSIGYENTARLIDYDAGRYGPYVLSKTFRFLPATTERGRTFLEERRLRAIGTIRDPRDIIVSMRERSKDLGNKDWSFEHTVTVDFPVWLGQFEQWIALEKNLTLVTRFEDMIVDLEEEVRRIAQHLNIKISLELVREIAKKYSLPEQQRRKQRFLGRKNRNDGAKEHPFLPSIPGWKFGTAGHWPKWLSPEEAKLVEKHARSYMRRGGYK